MTNVSDMRQVPERRFNEAEVAAILERATTRDESGRQMVPSGEGLTLSQLQDIGREIGISPRVIAESAELLDDDARTATRRFLGLPIGVERTVQLRRRLTDEEWERLVVELREVFDARGVLRREGSLRQWTNGNLQALLELTDSAQRVRLRTVKGNARGLMTLGLGAIGAASWGIFTAMLSGAGGDPQLVTELAVIAAAGAGTVGVTALRLIPWARRRREQMAAVAKRIGAIDRGRTPAIESTPAGSLPAEG
jgi:hypothetical protein